MAVNLIGLQLLASLYRRGALSNCRSVMEIGAQDLCPKQDEIARLLTSVVGFQGDADRVMTSELLYKSLGFTAYQCIDADGRYNAVAFDLSKDLARDYPHEERFDLVTNFGTTEHVFDQGRVFRSIHNLCAENGVMIHQVPLQRRCGQGLYRYQPTFVYDLASSNRYELFGMYLGLPTLGHLMPYSNDLARIFLRDKTDIDILAVMRKTRHDRFHTPYNGKYLKTCLFAEAYGHRGANADGVFANRTARMNSTSDINGMSTVSIARTLLRRLVAKVLSTHRQMSPRYWSKTP